MRNRRRLFIDYNEKLLIGSGRDVVYLDWLISWSQDHPRVSLWVQVRIIVEEDKIGSGLYLNVYSVYNHHVPWEWQYLTCVNFTWLKEPRASTNGSVFPSWDLSVGLMNGCNTSIRRRCLLKAALGLVSLLGLKSKLMWAWWYSENTAVIWC